MASAGRDLILLLTQKRLCTDHVRYYNYIKNEKKIKKKKASEFVLKNNSFHKTTNMATFFRKKSFFKNHF